MPTVFPLLIDETMNQYPAIHIYQPYFLFKPNLARLSIIEIMVLVSGHKTCMSFQAKLNPCLL
jgi:hypothetical protein